MLKPKPIWLQRLTPSSAWVTIAPHIYYPSHVTKPELYPDIIAHEEVHIKQQTAMGLKVWMTRYFGDREFRMDQECQAAAAQIYEYPSSKEWVIKEFESMLNSDVYMFCDISPETIKKTIEGYFSRYHTVEENPAIKRQRHQDSFKLSTYPFYPSEWDALFPPSSDTPYSKEDFVYEGYSSYPYSSINKGRRSNEDAQDKNTTPSYTPWYPNTVSVEKYLDRY